MRAVLLCAVLLACAPLTYGGQVLSRLAPRPTAVRGDASGDGDSGGSAPDLKQFELSLQRLRRSPNGGARAVRTVLEYLERVRDHPRDASKRKVCLWEPAFREYLATADGGLPCLHAAGFTTTEKDARGMPFLVMRRTSPRALRQLIAAASAALVEAETMNDLARMGSAADGSDEDADGAPGRTVVPPPLMRAVRSSSAAGGSGMAAAGGAAGGGDGKGEEEGGGERREGDGEALESPERALVQQISSMISGLIQELERQGGGGIPQLGPNGTDGAGSNETMAGRAPSPPIHFRVYRSPSFPGFPPGGGLPFLPGGLGGSVGGDGDEDGEVPVLERRLRAANLPVEAEEVAQRELKRLRRMSPMHSEYSTLVDYLEWLADLPWANATEDRLTISAARRQLEADHFGMEKVKARMLEYLSVCKLKGDLRGSILCLLGPPGIGKTSLGRSVADALNREFYRVSLGGVHSEAEIRGHRRTYVGAMPGLILQALKKCRTHNCVIMLDEIDKLGRNSLNGDPSSALLEVLDPEQNHAFRDHFLNLPFNLSRVLFIATANEMEGIPRPLRDRMEVIEMSGYTVQEKVQIASRHLLPKQRKHHGLSEGEISIDEDAIDALISGYTLEAGVRELDRQIAALCRWVAARSAEAAEAADEAAAAAEEVEEVAADGSAAAAAAEEEDADAVAGGLDGYAEASPTAAAGDATSAGGGASSSSGGGVNEAAAEADEEGWTGGVVRCEDIVTVLGPPKFDGPRDNVHRVSKPGIAVGLAYTPVGGDVLYVEAETMGGRGELCITGKLGDVMVESVKIAQAWVRAHAEELGIPTAGGRGHVLNGTDLHIHFPAGAMPKDGPSAGVTITTAVVSLLTGRMVRADLAMTGEITLRGLVLPVGGIKEKLIAAHRAGMRSVLIPAKNEKDLRELPPSVRAELNVTLVKDVSEVLAHALAPAPERADPTSSSTGGMEGESSGGARRERDDDDDDDDNDDGSVDVTVDAPPDEPGMPLPFPSPPQLASRQRPFVGSTSRSALLRS